MLRRGRNPGLALITAIMSAISQGEINVDQAHRGYDIVNDETGKAWYNPF